MKEIIAFCILALLVVLTCLLCDRRMEISSINDRLESLETMAYTSLPRIEIARGTVYAGEHQVTIERIEQ